MDGGQQPNFVGYMGKSNCGCLGTILAHKKNSMMA